MEVIYDELLLLFLRPAPFILLIIIGELDSTPIIIQTSFLPGHGRAGTLQPDSEEIALHLAEAYRAVGRNDDAKRILEKFGDRG